MNLPNSVVTAITIICILVPLLIGLVGFLVYQRLKRKKEGDKDDKDGKEKDKVPVKVHDRNKWVKAFWPIWAIAAILVVVTSYWPGMIQSYFNSQPLLFGLVLLAATALILMQVLTPSKPLEQNGKKKAFEFKFGTLIGWAAFVAAVWLVTTGMTSVVKEMTKPRPQVVKDMRKWTVIAPTNGWSEVVTTPYNYTTQWVAPNAKSILVLNIKKDDSKEEIVVTKIKDDDGIKGKALRFRSLSGNSERVDIEQWPSP